MEYMLNELSIYPVHSKIQVYSLMENFIHTAVAAESTLKMDRLRINKSIGNNLCDVYFMNDYSIGTWLSDNKVSKELKDKFLTITSLSPLVTSELEKDFINETCLYNGVSASGLKAALLYNTCCINFLTNECWNTHLLPVIHEYINGDKIESIPKQVRCFANTYHVDFHIDWLQENQREGLTGGNDIWEKRNEFFPNLIFCDSVKRNLAKLGVSTNLNNTINRLKELNNIAFHWKEGGFNYGEINSTFKITIHQESQLTLDNYASARRFRLPDGRREVFELHIITGSLRIHFYPDVNSHSIYVGYIGPHLRTWLYK